MEFYCFFQHLEEMTSKRTIAQIFWFHLSAISNVLDLAFSFCVFRKDLQTQSSCVSPAACGLTQSQNDEDYVEQL